jgi:adenylate cyclase
MIKLKQLLWQWRGVWITTPLMAVLVILVRSWGWLQLMELFMFDQYLGWRTPEKPDSRVVIVGIEEADINKIGTPIFPDRVYADLITKIKKTQPRAIGFDIFRDLAVEPSHQQLVEVFKSTNNLVGIEKLIGDRRLGKVPPPPELKQIGANDLIYDRDNKVRRALLNVKAQNGERELPSFAMYLAALYLERENITLQSGGEHNWWQLGKTVFVPLEKNDGSYVNADAGGYQIILNYRGAPGHFETVSVTDVLEDKLPPDWGRDRLILIGAVAESLQDLHLTPYTKTPSQRMPGIEIHANIASQIISAALEGRPLIKTWPEPRENLWIFYWAGMGAFIAWRMRRGDKGQLRFIQLIIGLSGAIIILLGITYLAFLSSWWLPVLPPLLALSASVIAITGYIARSAGQIRHTFGRYLSSEIVNILLESPEGIKLGGERRYITLLTSDLRGFTAISEKISPEEVVKILNFYLGCMANVITQYQGTIDEFMGDGILVLFGAPIKRQDDAERAVACAVAMQLEMDLVNGQMQEWGYPHLEMGIGINTGEVVVGNIGSEKRTKYGVVGSEVNLTYRIESYTIGGQILISEKTLKEIAIELKIREQKQVTPKGVKIPLTIYQIGGINGKYNLYLPQEEEPYVNLSEPIPIQYSLLHEKDISQTISEGKIVKLSPKGAQVVIDSNYSTFPDYLKNIKLNFLDLENEEDVYAKVISSEPDRECFNVYFTHLPVKIAKKITLFLNK